METKKRGQDDELNEAMLNLRRSPKRNPTPPSTAAKAIPKDSNKTKIKRTNPPGLAHETPKEKFDLKGQLTLKEMKFIELYLTGDLTVDKAMESAGYVGYHHNSLYRLGRKIVQKYEHQAGDHRKIMRALGWGEVRVIQSLIEAATGFKSEQVRLNARLGLAKCLGIQKEVLEEVGGISIIINTKQGISAGPGPQEPEKPLPPSSGPLRITR